MEINAYTNNKINNLKNLNNLKVQKNNKELNMQDFLNLLVAQITNQDALNPMENTEFIAQMAQFSTLQAMSDLKELTIQGQATSLIGKNIVVADYNNFGELEVQEGIVQRVIIHSGNTKIYVNDMEFDFSNVMEVKEAQVIEDPLPEILDNILKEIKEINNFDEETVPFTEQRIRR